MNKKAMSTGMIVILIVAGLFVYTTDLGGIKTTISGLLEGEPSIDKIPTSKCPSSGLTEVTINAQEALASTTTNANHAYAVFDNGVLVADGSSGSDGKSVFDVSCEQGKVLKAIIYNESDYIGYYPVYIDIKPIAAKDTHIVQLYEYGQINIIGVTNSVSNVGDTVDDWIPIGSGGKICGFSIHYSNNETASQTNNPLLIIEANNTLITDITMTGLTRANSEIPSRLSATTGSAHYAWKLPTLNVEDSPSPVSGRIQFGTTGITANKNDQSFKVKIIDETVYRMADWKTLGLAEGFIVSRQNDETIANIGSPDSNQVTLYIAYNDTGYSGYCG